jgi:LacI family transcriptional regulator, galactose operon repressor
VRPKAPSRPPTIVDVARAAGVSKSTVSNVIRSAEGVKDETRRAVVTAIQQLGYRPNAVARQLARQHTRIFGVIVGDLGNPFHAGMAKHVEREAASRGYATMFSNTLGDREIEGAAVEMMLEHRVAGIVFLAFSGPDEIRALLEGKLPVVFVGCSEGWADSVVAADRSGARIATEHLIELGHRRIAYLTTPLVEDRDNRSRLVGYREALRSASLSAGPVISWDPNAPGAGPSDRIDALAEIFRGNDPVTGVFASNDLAAIDLIDVADTMGLDVPTDLSVVGFDDAGIAGLSRISLTTVAQPQQELVRLGAEALVKRIEGGRTAEPRRRVVDVELVLRRSTAPPRTRRRAARR